MLLIVAAVPHLVTSTHWPTGRTDCPCIDPWALDIELNTNAPPATFHGCDIIRKGDRLCYNATYGASVCGEHDWSPTPECARLDAGSKPAWCASMWCYIDPQQCNVPSSESVFFPDATIQVASALGNASLRVPLEISYATCGYRQDLFNDNSAVAQLRAFAALQPSGTHNPSTRMLAEASSPSLT